LRHGVSNGGNKPTINPVSWLLRCYTFHSCIFSAK